MGNRLSRSIMIMGDTIEPELNKRIIHQAAKMLNDNPTEWISLEIFSLGGDWYSGTGLFDWLNHNVPNLQTVAYGLVASMAVAIFLAGKKRLVSANCRFLLHPAYANLEEPTNMDVQEYKAGLRNLQEIQDDYVRLLRSKMVNPPKDLERIIKRTTLIKPKKAIEWGLAHEFLGFE